MSIILLQIKDALKSVLNAFISSDLDVMSSEVREILSNPVDAKKYKEAVEKIEQGESEITIELSNHSKLTLIK